MTSRMMSPAGTRRHFEKRKSRRRWSREQQAGAFVGSLMRRSASAVASRSATAVSSGGETRGSPPPRRIPRVVRRGEPLGAFLPALCRPRLPALPPHECPPPPSRPPSSRPHGAHQMAARAHARPLRIFHRAVRHSDEHRDEHERLDLHEEGRRAAPIAPKTATVAAAPSPRGIRLGELLHRPQAGAAAPGRRRRRRRRAAGLVRRDACFQGMTWIMPAAAAWRSSFPRCARTRGSSGSPAITSPGP